MVKIKNKQTGFTIVELIVVIVVIAILVGVSTMAYGAWRTSTVKNVVKSDLSGAVAALMDARNFGGKFPTSIPTTFSASEGVQLSGGGSSNGEKYCVEGVSAESPGLVLYISSESASAGPQVGSCPEIDVDHITWQERAPVTSQPWSDIAMSADGTKISAVSTNGFMQSSSDAGVTWRQPNSSINGAVFRSVDMSANGVKIIAVATNHNVRLSTDSGSTLLYSTYSGQFNWSSVAYNSAGTFAIFGVSSGYIYTSNTDGAGYFTQQSSAPLADWKAVAASSSGSRLVAVASSRHIYTSTDYGATWIERTGSGARLWTDVAISNDGLKIVATATGAYGAHIYTSENFGATWTERSSAGA